LTSFNEIPLSETSIAVWKERLRYAGIEFENDEALLQYVTHDPNPNDIEQAIVSTQYNNYLTENEPSDFVKTTIENDGGSWTDISSEFHDEDEYEI